jgi:DNA-binding NarL/FixJ family response regulator
MNRTISIVLADDHVLFRQALRQLLEMERDFAIVAEAGDGAKAIDAVEQHHPDVILLDISMPGMDGISATGDLRRKYPSMGIIILSMFAEDAYIIRAIRAGANGYLLKNSEAGKVIEAIRAAARGESILEPYLVTKLLNEFRRMSEVSEHQNVAGLTAREIELLRLVASGQSNKEIAQTLDLAESTVKNRLSILFQKLEVKDRTQAAIYAMSRGLAATPMQPV